MSLAQLEFQIAEENIKTKASWNVDYPIGWGEYEDKTFQGEHLGFVIFGMGEADTRLTLLPDDTVAQENVWFLFTRRYKNSYYERLLSRIFSSVTWKTLLKGTLRVEPHRLLGLLKARFEREGQGERFTKLLGIVSDIKPVEAFLSNELKGEMKNVAEASL